MTIGAKIKTMRSARGLSLAALSELGPWSTGRLSEYETGKKIPTIGTLSAIAKSLGFEVTIDIRDVTIDIRDHVPWFRSEVPVFGLSTDSVCEVQENE